MKTHKSRTATLLSLLAIVVLAACGNQERPTPVATEAAPTTPTAPADAATLSEIVNLVEAALADQNDFKPVANGFVLNTGGQVRTARDSGARLDLTNSTIIRLGQDSLFKMEELTPGSDGPLVRLKLEFGKLWVSLAGGAVEVETPVGSASVRGSFGIVEYDSSLDVLTLSCLEGTCKAENDTVKEQLGNLEQARLTRGGQDVTRTQLTLDDVKAFTDVNPDQGPALLATLLAAPPATATEATLEPTAAETKGAIGGVVNADLNLDGAADDSGEGPLGGVNVTLSGCISVSVTLVTGDDGKFAFDSLPAGICLLQVEKAGWGYASVSTGETAYPIQVGSAPGAPADLSIFMTPKETPTAQPTIAIVPQQNPTDTSAPTPTATLTPMPQAQIDFNADKTFLLAGECTVLRWTVLNVQAVFLDGAGVASVDTKEVCPQETTTYKLTVQTIGGAEERTVTLVITAPTPTVTTTPDVAGPAVANLSATDPSNYGCNSNTTFNAKVTDPSGIKRVEILYRYENANQVGGWWSAPVTDLGNGSYSAAINNDDSAIGAYNVLRGSDGDIRWYVLGTDSLGNTTKSDELLVRILVCPS